MKKPAFLLFLFSFFLLYFSNSTAMALETDQFHAAAYELKDASAQINEYVQERMNRAISRANEKKLNCEELSDAVMTEIVGKHSISQISQFAKTSPEIERFPEDSVSSKDYIKQSIYKDAGFPFNLGLIARTINVGGVYIGTDKLGHFALIGRNYFRRFLELRKSGLSSVQAEKETVLKGIAQEVHFLGYTLGGVLSYGDLEANYQGLQFARNLCEGANPFIIKKEKEWQLNPYRTFDIRKIINPKMDESFVPAFWKPNLWKKVKPVIKEVYCDLKHHPLYLSRIAFYQSRMEKNRNDEFVKEFFATRPKFIRSLENIDRLCE